MDTRTVPATRSRSPEPDDDLAMRAVLACARGRRDARQAERALLEATEELAVCSCTAWEKRRSAGTTAERLFVELQQTRLLLREARERGEILAARFEKIEPRRRPYYTPPLRFRILEHMKRYMLSVEETARRFLVSPQTLYNWLAEVRCQPDRDAVGSMVRPVPPVLGRRSAAHPADGRGGLWGKEEDRPDASPERLEGLASVCGADPQGEAPAAGA
jgi:hypothetical protein